MGDFPDFQKKLQILTFFARDCEGSPVFPARISAGIGGAGFSSL